MSLIDDPALSYFEAAISQAAQGLREARRTALEDEWRTSAESYFSAPLRQTAAPADAAGLGLENAADIAAALDRLWEARGLPEDVRRSLADQLEDLIAQVGESGDGEAAMPEFTYTLF